MLLRGVLTILPLGLMIIGMSFYWRHGYRLATQGVQEKNRLQGRFAMNFAFWSILTASIGIGLIVWQVSKAEARAVEGAGLFICASA